MKKLKGFKYELIKHLSDATSVSSFSIPIKAVTDQFAGLSDMESIESRAKITALNYFGLVQLIKLRDYSKKKLGISKSKSKVLHYAHDMAFTAGISIPIQTAIYVSSGVTDWKEIAMAIGTSTGVFCVLAGPLGQFIDTYRELVRVRKSKNTPSFFKGLENKTKKKVAVGLVAGSLALTGLLYSAIPNKNSEVQHQKTPTIEKMIEEEASTVYSEKILEEQEND